MVLYQNWWFSSAHYSQLVIGDAGAIKQSLHLALHPHGTAPTFLKFDPWSPGGGFYSYYIHQGNKSDKKRKSCFDKQIDIYVNEWVITWMFGRYRARNGAMMPPIRAANENVPTAVFLSEKKQQCKNIQKKKIENSISIN